MSELQVGIGVHEGDVCTMRQAGLSLCAHFGRTDVLFTCTMRQAGLGRVSTVNAHEYYGKLTSVSAHTLAELRTKLRKP